MQIRWTPTARKTYFSVLDYLYEYWTVKEMHSFIEKVEHVLELIKENPNLFEVSRKKKNVRKCTITPHNKLIYRVKPRKKEIDLIMFWDNRRNTTKLKY
ncbi:MAG: type II toxin-antitoxin system RelE/ParE family toxin [Bacteroidales bacterium]|nr:type II toxin-antitoxin system RelE/ParE family toxin [Bacteroidales bacterium]